MIAGQKKLENGRKDERRKWQRKRKTIQHSIMIIILGQAYLCGVLWNYLFAISIQKYFSVVDWMQVRYPRTKKVWKAVWLCKRTTLDLWKLQMTFIFSVEY